MSDLGSLVAAPFTPAGGASDTGTPAASTATAPEAGGGSSISSLLSSKFTAPTQSEPSTTTPAIASLTYTPFQGEEPDGSFVGISDETDPFSGRPYLAYKEPGEATTTDLTRTAPAMNPELAAPTPKADFENPRMPEEASEAVRVQMGATDAEQLDHRMALALGGSNDNANLKPIPTAENQAAGADEETMAGNVADGTESLFQAQNQEAANKGLPAPWTGTQVKKASALDQFLSRAANAFSIAQTTPPAGTPPAAWQPNPDAEAIGKSIATAGVNLYNGTAVPQILHGIATGDWSQYISKLNSGPSLADMVNGTPQAKQQMMNYVLGFINPEGGIAEDAAADAAKAEALKNAPTTADEAAARYTKEVIDPKRATDGPLTISGDDMKAHFGGDYAPEKSPMYSQAAYKIAQDEIKNGSRKDIAMMGGGPGAGKTERLVQGLKDSGFKGVIYDGTLSNYNGVKDIADLAKANGKDLQVHGILPDLDKARGFTIQRAAQTGREVTDADFARGHAGFPAAMEKLLENGDIKPDQVNLIDARDGEPKVSTDPLATLKTAQYSEEDLKHTYDRNSYNEKGERILPKPGVQEDVGQIRSGTAEGGQGSAEGKAAAESVGKVDEGATSEVSKTIQKTAGSGALPEWKEAGFDSQKEYQAALKDINELSGESKADTVRKILSGKINFKPSEVDASEWKTILGNSYYKVFKKSAASHVDEAASELGYKNAEDLKNDVADEVYRRFNEKGSKTTTAKETPMRTLSESLEHPEEENDRGVQAPRAPYDKAEGDIEPGQRIIDKIPPPPQTEDFISRTGERIKPGEELNTETTEQNGGVTPPINKGGLQAPEIPWIEGKDRAAPRLAGDTLVRNLEKIFPRDVADSIKEFLTDPAADNETDLARAQTQIRKQFKTDVVDALGIKPHSIEAELLQRYGEGLISLDQLKELAPDTWENIQKAVPIFRTTYDQLIDLWNQQRFAAGMKQIGKLPNYFRHFVDLGDFLRWKGFVFRDSQLPTAISGLTHNFRPQTPWASAAMRRFGVTTDYDAITGLDNYIDSTLRAIYHTDTVQRATLLEKYLRQSAEANPEIKLQNFAANLTEWKNKVAGKQSLFDRAIEGTLGRKTLGFLRAVTQRFGANEINANLSAAITHSLPIAYLPGTTDLGSIFKGLIDTAISPLQEDFRQIDGTESAFLTRRFRQTQIAPTTAQKAGKALASPFKAVSQFMSRLTVASKYFQGIAGGLSKDAAMRAADDYATRVISDRSTGQMPNIMTTKTLGMLSQFQVEVNNSLHYVLHDVPYMSEGDKFKIAKTYTALALSLYLYNHMMNEIKGSGKGFDPIDLALTVAGVGAPFNMDSSSVGQPLRTRLATAGTDFAGELPFSSVITAALGQGGQIPAAAALAKPLEDVGTAITDDVAGTGKAGDWMKAAVDAAVPFASPIGGGVQAQKTYEGIQAWKQGYVTALNGDVKAKIPQTIPELIKGAAFGTSAFPEVQSTSDEETSLLAAEAAQTAQSQSASATAQGIWDSIKAMPADEGKAQLAQLAAQDPDMAKRVVAAAKTQSLGLTKTDNMLKTLGIANGDRTRAIYAQLSTMSDDDAKRTYLAGLASKGLLTAAMLPQLSALMKQ